MKKKDAKQNVTERLGSGMEHIIIFIIILITIIEFLIYGAGVSEGKYIAALTAMLTLLNFGALLIIITLLLRIIEKMR